VAHHPPGFLRGLHASLHASYLACFDFSAFYLFWGGGQSLLVGDLKLLSHPAGTDCGSTHAGWYPPPGMEWDYAGASQTVQCGKPPANPDITTVCTEAKPCLFNVTADPCECVATPARAARATRAMQHLLL